MIKASYNVYIYIPTLWLIISIYIYEDMTPKDKKA